MIGADQNPARARPEPRGMRGGGLFVCLLVAIGGADVLKAPFPWFGGKSRAAHLVWAGFGDVANYVEPFAGSLAVLLGRPTEPRIETVNDLDCYLANFWRAVKWAPELVAEHADWPVNEADLHARHRDLVARVEFRRRMKREPKYFDAEIAGWWVWGLCQWIGGGWCASSNWEGPGSRSRGVNTAEEARRPNLHSNGVHRRQIETAEVEGRPHLMRNKGVHARKVQDAESASGKRPTLSKPGRGVHANQAFGRTNGSTEWEGRGGSHRRPAGIHTAEKRSRDLVRASEWEKRPRLDGAGGVHSQGLSQQMPMIRGDSGASGSGVHASALHNKLPMLSGAHGHAGRGVHASGETAGPLVVWMKALAERLRRVRVCCGNWERVLGPSSTVKIGVTGVLLDPPYSAEAGRDPSLYAAESATVAHDVREWAVANGDHPKLRIALCGYEGEHDMPATWECVAWKAAGGYAASAGNNENAARERIWFSPACAEVRRQRELFEESTGRVVA